MLTSISSSGLHGEQGKEGIISTGFVKKDQIRLQAMDPHLLSEGCMLQAEKK